jgi:phosphoribosylformylglycinamidine synthase
VRFSVAVEVQLRPGVADPQGSTIERSLPTLGFDGVSGVRVGKLIRFAIDADSEVTARSEVDDLCRRFLTNPVIEDAAIRIEVDAEDNAAQAPAGAAGDGRAVAEGRAGEPAGRVAQ